MTKKSWCKVCAAAWQREYNEANKDRLREQRLQRYAALRYEGRDPQGNPIRREVSGFHARVVQHECDHLDGILYPMRMTDMRRFGYTEILFPDAEGEE